MTFDTGHSPNEPVGMASSACCFGLGYVLSMIAAIQMRWVRLRKRAKNKTSSLLPTRRLASPYRQRSLPSPLPPSSGRAPTRAPDVCLATLPQQLICLCPLVFA